MICFGTLECFWVIFQVSICFSISSIFQHYAASKSANGRYIRHVSKYPHLRQLWPSHNANNLLPGSFQVFFSSSASDKASQLVKWQLEEGWSWDRKAHTGGWICQWGYMDFLKLLQGFVKVVMSHSQMLGKFEYGLPAKFWRLVGCTEMLSW